MRTFLQAEIDLKFFLPETLGIFEKTNKKLPNLLYLIIFYENYIKKITRGHIVETVNKILACSAMIQGRVSILDLCFLY